MFRDGLELVLRIKSARFLRKRRRHVKTIAKKKDADVLQAQVRVDVRKGVHVPESKSLTVEEAGRGWIDSCGDLERTTRDGYEQHLRDHINPFIGAVRPPLLTVAGVRDWQDKLRKAGRSADMVKRVPMWTCSPC